MSNKDMPAPEAHKLAGYFSFLIRNPDYPIENDSKDLLNLVMGKIIPPRDKKWFHADDKVPVAEFDVSDLLSVYSFFAEENGNSLIGGLDQRGLVSTDVICVHPRFFNRKGFLPENPRRDVIILPKPVLLTLKEKFPKLNISTNNQLRNGLCLLPQEKTN